MNLENLTHVDFPFNHWVFRNCLENGALDEISFSLFHLGPVLIKIVFQLIEIFFDI